MLVFESWTDKLSALTGASCFRRAQAGGRDALNGLMDEHQRLVRYILRQQSSGSLS